MILDVMHAMLLRNRTEAQLATLQRYLNDEPESLRAEQMGRTRQQVLSAGGEVGT